MKPITVGKILAAFILVAALLASPALAQKTGVMSTPIIACGAGTTGASIHINFTAGSPTGAPAGFSLQWMSLADFQANGDEWYLSSDSRLCKGSYSGNAFESRYNLLAGQSPSPDIMIGDMMFDNGASTNCNEPLLCGTKYVFHAFSHANSKLKRSDWTADLVCKTLACSKEPTCTFTQGYWKTHGPIPTGNNSNVWPVTSLSLGSVAYTDLQLLSILNKPVQGNGLIALAHQLIAAKLNVANGADDTDALGPIAAADALIGALVVPPVGAGSLLPGATSGLTTTLANYNEGSTGPGHCP